MVKQAWILAGCLVSAAAADDATRTYVVTDPAGSHVVTEDGPTEPVGGGVAGSGISWTYSHVSSIPETLGISSAADRVWVGQWLNVERIQQFDLDGDGTPLDEFPAGPVSPAVVHAAEDADLAILLDGSDGALVLKAYTSTSTMPQWDFSFAANYNAAGFKSARVSRDGSIVCCVVYDPGATTADLHIFDGPSGALLDNWTYPGFATGVDLNDDGSLCLVTQSSSGRLIDTATAAMSKNSYFATC